MSKPNKYNKNRNDSTFKPDIEDKRDMKDRIAFTGTTEPKKFGRHERAIYPKPSKGE